MVLSDSIDTKGRYGELQFDQTYPVVSCGLVTRASVDSLWLVSFTADNDCPLLLL